MREIGADLFSAVFDAHAEARALWRAVASQLNATRVVVTSAPDVAVGIPWELIADPASGQTLATDARAFVRALRALVIVARPVGTDDVPFRSVAPRIVAAAAERGDIRVDVLRPPTPEAMSARLREAAAAGQRYDIVHFDGHGTYGAPSDRATAAQRGRLWLENGREGGSAVTGEWLVAALLANPAPLVGFNTS